MDENHTTICIDGMSVEEEQIYLKISWWLEGIVHVMISVVGLVANSISMTVMLSKGKHVFKRKMYYKFKIHILLAS